MLTSDLIISRESNSTTTHPLSELLRSFGNTSVAIKAWKPKAPAGTKSVKSWLDELDQDPEFAADVRNARIKISETVRSEGPSTIRALRLRAGLSQHELAATVRATQANISRIETGLQLPTLETAVRLSKTLHISLDELVEALQVG